MTDPITNRLALPVTIILERRIIQRSFWSVPSWYLHSVAVGRHVAAAQAGERVVVPAGSSEKGHLFAWSGFEVTLYKDACERYWHGLIGDRPRIYVVCREHAEAGRDEAGAVTPALTPMCVSIDYDQATSAVEHDDLVLDAPIPPELYRYMETFVLQHYRPRQFRKRRRRDWSGNDAGEEHKS